MEKLKQPEDFILFNTCADPEFVQGGGGGGGASKGYQYLSGITIFGNLIWLILEI